MLSDQAYGSLLSLCGALVLCPDTLLLRLVSGLDIHTVCFFRYLFSGVMTFLHIVVSEKTDKLYSIFINIGVIGIMAGIFSALSHLLFLTAIQYSNVATVLVISSSSSLFTAIFSAVFLRESIPLRTIATCLIAMLAVGVILFDHHINSSIEDRNTGTFAAIGSAICFGLQLVTVRWSTSKGDMNLLPMNVLAACLLCLYSLVASVQPPSIGLSSKDYLYLGIQGCIILPLSSVCLTLGPQYIPAAEVSLYIQIITVIAPILVWLGGFEAPPNMTIYGGTILIVALAVNNFLALRELKQFQPAAAWNKDNEITNPYYDPLAIMPDEDPMQSTNIDRI
jgi:drug/metabolite transporter (DMT)-like permease